MKWPLALRWIALVATLALLGRCAGVAKAAPAPRGDDMFRELMKLDQLYSSIARPSVRSVPTSPEVGPKVQRALNMLRLQQLDRLYADKSRPRFGKRTRESDHLDGNRAAVLPALTPFDLYDSQYRSEQGPAADWPPARR